MGAVLETGKGIITYNNDFIGSIAGLTATECAGVVGMATKRATDAIPTLLGRDNVRKGVKVFTDETNSLKIELYIIVEFGVAIAATGENIIDAVKYTVEQLTGLTVSEVNIIVSGIRV